VQIKLLLHVTFIVKNIPGLLVMLQLYVQVYLSVLIRQCLFAFEIIHVNIGAYIILRLNICFAGVRCALLQF
jgi:hypothetical protein